ncbi:RNA polymerase sigma factor [Aquisphaera giovannonii]|uniref:RNA polymerase sigma factor n=1 Tax=Aquisphaera giovannonii TaxID=406548 RepID=A0A5B9W6M2_9BACT|nr:sigma-70 family RNA polymerase sigma factor [Aquisphaera giovannonii]QEH35620.1 RNA polymerase sigma factor [Aquisphaera giovannonii]
MSTPGHHEYDSCDTQFPETQWSLVLKAREPGTVRAEALNALCTRYWYPIYSFIRRKGNPPEKSRDLTQSYFCELLRKDLLLRADQGKGRFRAFLRADCSHFLVDQHRRETAALRAPEKPLLSIDLETAEGLYLMEPAHGETAERIFERNWAWTLLDRVLERLREEAEHSGDRLRFKELAAALGGAEERQSYAVIAARLGLSEQAVATAVHRLRRKYRELLRAEIAATLADPADVDDEIRALFDALSA